MFQRRLKKRVINHKIEKKLYFLPLFNMSKNIKKFIVATSYLDSLSSNEEKKKDNDNFKFTKPCMRVIFSHWGEYSCCDVYGCSYAHSLSELRIPKCLYGHRCYKKDLNCMFIHPHETKEDFYNRTGWNIPDLPQTSTLTHCPGFSDPVVSL